MTLAFLSVFILLTGVYTLFLLRIRQGLVLLSAPSPVSDRHPLPSVSVIVPVCNEERRIEACVASLRAQECEGMDVRFLVVDDSSVDATLRLAREAAAGDARFTVLPADGGARGKKAAITRGIAAARGDFILTTDADCRHRAGWVRAVAARAALGVDVIAGPVLIRDRSSLFERLQALDFLGLMGVGAGFFGIGYPRLCNGANFAYRRELFHRAGGYAGNASVPSGDDEFLLHRMVYALGAQAAFLTEADAIVETLPVETVRGFLAQRRRWASKGIRYEDGRFISFLVLLFFYFCACVLAPFVVRTSPFAVAVAALLCAVKWGTEGAVLFRAARLFGAPVRGTDLFIAELLHPVYLVFVSILGLFGSGTWKTRTPRRET